MEVRPSRHVAAAIRVALFAALIGGALALGDYSHGQTSSIVAARRLARHSAAARVESRAARTGRHVPVTLSAPRPHRLRPATALGSRKLGARSSRPRLHRAHAEPKRTRTVADIPGDAPLLQPFADPPPAEALAISGVSASATSTSVTVSWQTNFQASGQGAEAIGATPVIWTAPDAGVMPSALTHQTVFTGLAPATTYNFWVQATDEWNRTAAAELTATTSALPLGPTPASTNGSEILVAGQPFFPIALWEDCTNLAAEHMAVGVNLFIREGCGHEDKLAASLQGRAYAVVDAHSGIADQRGVIGWYYQDELDGRQPPTLTAADVSKLAITPPPGMLTFLTLTNHFYSGADPLAFPRSVYPAFAALANVVSFDLYPLQEWCRGDRIGDVFDSEHELAALASPKPTFEWIEVRHMKCDPTLDPTPQTVEAETWLAIAGGATGIGYFPHEWPLAVGAEIRALDDRIGELKTALLAPQTEADAPLPLKVGARSFDGALYVIAVNPSRTSVDGAVHVDGADARTFNVLGEDRDVVATGGVIKDSFTPLGVHIYVSAPVTWSSAPAAN